MDKRRGERERKNVRKKVRKKEGREERRKEPVVRQRTSTDRVSRRVGRVRENEKHRTGQGEKREVMWVSEPSVKDNEVREK